MKQTYTITGMHCKNCVAKIKAGLEAVSEVTQAEISLHPPEAKVEMREYIPIAMLNAALTTSAGDYVLTEKIGAEPVSTQMHHEEPQSSQQDDSQSLQPLFIIVSYIIGGVLIRALISGDYSPHVLMGNFMGGFFILFSLFKMIDLKGFAEGFSTYDIVAKKSRAYALAYPFMELFLGVAYVGGMYPEVTNVLTIVLMAIGTIGVAKALAEKRIIQCACLGTALKLPMTKVTLAEDIVMGIMAVLMLLSI